MMNNKKSVFYVSLAFSLVLISLGAFIPDKLEAFSNYSLGFIYNNLGWFILGAVFIFLVFVCISVFKVWSYSAWRGQ